MKHTIAIFVVLVALGAPLVAQSVNGSIEFLQGDVRVNGVPVDFGDPVAVGDWVQTGPNGRADIVFDRSNVFRLGPNTVAILNLGSARQQVDLKFGTMSAVFEKVRTLAGNGTFDIRTPTGVGGVRGTVFFFRVVDANTTYVCACNGTLELTPSAGDSFLESATQHSGYLFKRSDDGSVVVEKAGLLYHDNESMNEVADEIGATIPWGQKE